MKGAAVVVGNTDGIGLALTKQLLERGFEVTGISKRASTLVHEAYRHCVLDVSDAQYKKRLAEILPGDRLRLCVYCAGIGEHFSLHKMALDVAIFEVNLMGLVRTAEVVVPCLAAGDGGVFAGLSSLADVMPAPEAPAYAASKAGMTHYLEGLAEAVVKSRVSIVNVRLGFVDTKMAKAKRKPLMVSSDEAARRILRTVTRHHPPSRLNIPRRAALILGILAPAVRLATRCKYRFRGY